MPFSLVALYSTNSRRTKTIEVTATPTGAYTPGGDPIDLTTLVDTTFQGNCFPGSVPKVIKIENSAVGYTAEIIATGTVPATLSNAYKMKVFSGGGAELPAAAYPAGLLADAFLLELVGPNWGF